MSDRPAYRPSRPTARHRRELRQTRDREPRRTLGRRSTILPEPRGFPDIAPGPLGAASRSLRARCPGAGGPGCKDPAQMRSTVGALALTVISVGSALVGGAAPAGAADDGPSPTPAAG